MRKMMCVFAALLCLLPAVSLSEALPEQLTLTVGENREFSLPFSGYWESDAPEVAQVTQTGVVTALSAGEVRRICPPPSP